jgi:hypothetical protein
MLGGFPAWELRPYWRTCSGFHAANARSEYSTLQLWAQLDELNRLSDHLGLSQAPSVSSKSKTND